MRLFVPVIASLLLVPLASCGSRAQSPAQAQAAEPTEAAGAPAPGEAERIGASDADFNAAMTPWMKEGYYADIIAASRARLAKDPSNGGARFSLAYALYYNGDFAQSATEAQKVAQLPGYENRPQVQEILNNAQALAGRYAGQTFAPISWEQDDVAATAQKWQQLGTSLIVAGNYDEIERTAAQLTAKPEIMADGSWTLGPFFVGLWVGDDDTDAGWLRARERIETWVAAKPDSQLAQVALARAWTEGALLARGDQYSDKVSDAAWKTVDERLQHAAPIFRKLLNAPKIATPLVYSSAQRFGRLGQAPREWQDKVFARGVVAFPQYSDFYFQREFTLLPRYDGAPGEWEKDAAKFADAQPNKEAGAMLYARIVASLWEYHSNMKEETNLDWPRTKRGFDAILKYYPDSLFAATLYLRLCHQYGDYAQARQVLQVIGGRGDMGIWDSRTKWAQTRNFLLKAP